MIELPAEAVNPGGALLSLADRARRGPLELGSIVAGDAALVALRDVLEEVLEDARYAPYLARQDAEIARLQADEGLRLDAIPSFAAIPGLSNEMVERLDAARPTDLAAAGRIRGITPAALSMLMMAARRRAA